MNKKSAFFVFSAVFVDETANSSILKSHFAHFSRTLWSILYNNAAEKVQDLSTYPVSNTTIYTVLKHMNIVLLRSVSSNLEGLLRNMHLSSNHSEQVGMWDKLR